MPLSESFLQRRKNIILEDARLKLDAEDWHGVADAMMDIREIDAQLKLLASLTLHEPSAFARA